MKEDMLGCRVASGLKDRIERCEIGGVSQWARREMTGT